MSVEYERWYDKDNNVSQLFHFLEGMDKRNRKIIANEILQIIFAELNIDINTKVRELTNLKHGHNKRWYDEDTEVQSAIEVIKSLSAEQSHELMIRIVETLQQFIIKSEGM